MQKEQLTRKIYLDLCPLPTLFQNIQKVPRIMRRNGSIYSFSVRFFHSFLEHESSWRQKNE